MGAHPLLDLERLDDALEPYLESVGRVFRSFLRQDSGNRCYGVAIGDDRWFVKLGANPAIASSLVAAAATL